MGRLQAIVRNGKNLSVPGTPGIKHSMRELDGLV